MSEHQCSACGFPHDLQDAATIHALRLRVAALEAAMIAGPARLRACGAALPASLLKGRAAWYAAAEEVERAMIVALEDRSP